MSPRFAAFVLLFVAPGVLAGTTICTRNREERRVEVAYAEAGKKLPCSVKYHRGGTVKTLWGATSKEGFCEEKATGFLGRLVESGFHCEDAP